MEGQIQQAAKQLVLTERAWISPSVRVVGPLTADRDGFKISLLIELVNLGKSPAVGIQINPSIYLLHKDRPSVVEKRKSYLPRDGCGFRPGRGEMLFPGSEPPYSVRYTMGCDAGLEAGTSDKLTCSPFMPLTTGDKLGPDEILAPLGAGGMGEVYRAKDTKLGREVAVKILPAALAQNTDRLSRFEREAKVLASLNHPNIAQIYGLEGHALVMELVPGETLKGPLPLDTALNYAKQIAEALEAAHDKGIVHRDLKPGNIITRAPTRSKPG